MSPTIIWRDIRSTVPGSRMAETTQTDSLVAVVTLTADMSKPRPYLVKASVANGVRKPWKVERDYTDLAKAYSMYFRLKAQAEERLSGDS